jgi:uncharacterized protein (UPF0210 family)
MFFTPFEITETVDMFLRYRLDIRAIPWMCPSLIVPLHPGPKPAGESRKSFLRIAGPLVKIGQDLEIEYGIPIINKCLAVSPLAMIAAVSDDQGYTPYAQVLDGITKELDIDFVGSFSALVQKGISQGDQRLIDSIPNALSCTERVCASVNVASNQERHQYERSTPDGGDCEGNRGNDRFPRWTGLR